MRHDSLFLLVTLLAACSSDDPEPELLPSLVYVEQSAADTSVARLVRLHADGSARQVLYDDAEAGLLAPAPTPDGEKILFGDRATSGDITWHLVPVGGGPATTIAAPPGVEQPRWSPDGNSIAWYSSEGSGSIGVSTPGGTTFGVVTPADWAVNNRMSWAPYNTELVIERRLPGGDIDLYILTTGGATIGLSVGEHLDYGPGWSPDGNEVAFLRNDLTDASSGIYTVSGDGTGVRQIAVGRFFSEVHWSSDGKFIATSRFAGPNGDFQLVTVDVGTGAVTPVFTPSALWEYYANPWSPGKAFLLETDRNAAGRSAVITTSGGRQQVTHDSVSATSPTWIPE